ncbi:hypothetical protein [Paenibacillus sp. ATY16]|uniref:hypothetical protein n=1 Tax=Paenibacillus sp. ATY16 TaxID=1759312 RepID=UPI00200D241C|nr:hypothetical protein [Paenibacillus sp. ATY16]
MAPIISQPALINDDKSFSLAAMLICSISNGIPVKLKRYPGMIHTFYALTDVFEDGNDVYLLINNELQGHV